MTWSNLKVFSGIQEAQRENPDMGFSSGSVLELALKSLCAEMEGGGGGVKGINADFHDPFIIVTKDIFDSVFFCGVGHKSVICDGCFDHVIDPFTSSC